MTQAQKNKEFILRYFNALSGQIKTIEKLHEFMSDQVLIDTILFFDSAFPKYEHIAEEMISEGNQVVVRARFKGKHEGEFSGVKPSHKNVDFNFVANYTIVDNKIVTHWLVADQISLMEQLGVQV